MDLYAQGLIDGATSRGRRKKHPTYLRAYNDGQSLINQAVGLEVRRRRARAPRGDLAVVYCKHVHFDPLTGR